MSFQVARSRHGFSAGSNKYYLADFRNKFYIFRQLEFLYSINII